MAVEKPMQYSVPWTSLSMVFGIESTRTPSWCMRILRHEVGHVLGLGHPPAGADAGTVMATTSSHSVDNPTRNTLGNYRRITWPLPVVPTCIHPDPMLLPQGVHKSQPGR